MYYYAKLSNTILISAVEMKKCKLCSKWSVCAGSGQGSSGAQDTSDTVLHSAKPPPPHSRVYCWGGGITAPTLLPLPSTDIHIREVSTGRTQKAAVTNNGRLLLWEVGRCALNEEYCITGSIPIFTRLYLHCWPKIIYIHVYICGKV